MNDPRPANNKAIKQADVDSVKPINNTEWMLFDTVLKFNVFIMIVLFVIDSINVQNKIQYNVKEVLKYC